MDSDEIQWWLSTFVVLIILGFSVVETFIVSAVEVGANDSILRCVEDIDGTCSLSAVEMWCTSEVVDAISWCVEDIIVESILVGMESDDMAASIFWDIKDIIGLVVEGAIEMGDDVVLSWSEISKIFTKTLSVNEMLFIYARESALFINSCCSDLFNLK
jgi:hypothetical protein